MVIAILTAGVLAVVFARLAASFYDNPRPFVSDGTPALISHGADNGFPSEHTAFAATISTLIYFYSRRLFVAALLITLLVGWGRVATHVHHGIDIIAGLVIGVVAGCLAYWLSKAILFRRNATAAQADHKDKTGS